MAALASALGKIEEYSEIFDKAKELLNQVVTDKSVKDEIPFHCALAASFGTLTSGAFKQMDDDLLATIAPTTKLLSHLTDPTWHDVLAVMKQNVFIRPQERGPIFRSDKLIKSGHNWFKFKGIHDESIIQEVYVWFKKLILDADVLKDTKIDIKLMANVVAVTSNSIEHFLGALYQDKKNERQVVEVGMLRYPDIDTPYFKVYRIQLFAWNDTTRYVFYQEYKNGIRGEYNCTNFVPRESTLQGIKASSYKKALQEAEDLLS